MATIPNTITTTHLDGGSDDIAQARTEIYNMALAVNGYRAYLSPILGVDGTVATARTTLGLGTGSSVMFSYVTSNSTGTPGFQVSKSGTTRGALIVHSGTNELTLNTYNASGTHQAGSSVTFRGDGGGINVGSTRLTNTGNVWLHYRSQWLSDALTAIEGTFISIDRVGLESNNRARCYMRQTSTGTTTRLVASPSWTCNTVGRNSGYLEWDTDIGAVGTTYFLSDVNMKENIAPSTVDASSRIAAIPFVQFDWKEGSGNNGHVENGVVAQDLQQIQPRWVTELSDGKLMVNEPALLADVAKALQEALAEIASLKARVAALEA